MKVLKFGGTSVQNAEAIQNVVRIIQSKRPSPLLIVVSACAGVTNALLALVQFLRDGKTSEARVLLHDVRQRHKVIADDLLEGEVSLKFNEQLEKDCAELEREVRSFHRQGILESTSDAVVSFGERWSSQFLFSSLVQQEIPSEFIDSRDLLVTNNEFTKATPFFEETNARVQKFLTPHLEQGKVIVTQGFVGSTVDGLTTTIGRGGSDYSASIFGAALGAEEIEIWTDTDGILSADPRLVPEAVSLREISTEEATELAHFGAKVVHPSTLAPATDAKIPVKILNSFRPHFEGTLIRPVNGSSRPEEFGVKSITGKKGVCTVAIRKNKRMNKFHFLQHVFHVLENHKEVVEFISSSETGVLVLTNDEEDHRPFLEELRHHESVEIREELAILSVVGNFDGNDRPISSQVHDILREGEIPFYLAYNGVSTHSHSVVIDGKRLEEGLSLLHRRFIGEQAGLRAEGERGLRLVIPGSRV